MNPSISAACSLEGRVAAVTGGAPGLGREAAMVLAPAAAVPVLADIAEEGLAEIATTSPLGNAGTPLDIAVGMLCLASDASRFVTGHNLGLSGGVAMP